MSSQQPGFDQTNPFAGFDKAQRLMWCHSARARIFQRIESTPFLNDHAVVAIHVDNTFRADRAILTTFNSAGKRLGGETLYIDDPTQRLDVTPEFDHDYTGMAVPIGTDLAAHVASETGWVIDLAALRNYDLTEDRRVTQRAVLLAHMADMIIGGEVRSFMFDIDAAERNDDDSTDQQDTDTP